MALLLKKKKKNLLVKQQEEKPKYKDLREIMDYSRPLSIFYSGVEYESYLDLLYSLGIRNFLMSYEYLKGKGIPVLKKYSDIHLFIDSGAFTYMNDPKYKDYSAEHWEKQIQEYLSWVEKHKNQIFACADLDLQYLVGEEKVYEWRRKYFEPFMLRTGVPVCFMYHEEGIQQWEFMCKRYPYVGLSLGVDSAIDEGELRERFRIAEKYNTLVQGMASTRTNLLTQIPFYTVDSTTWNVGLKYGEISVWNKTKMSRIKKADFQSKAFPIIQTYDRKFDFDLILQEDKEEMIKVNAYAFVQAEKYIHDRLKATMYWLKAKTVKQDVDNLPADFFPSAELLMKGVQEEIKAFAPKMNINPDYEDAVTVVGDMTCLLNWDNEEYKEVITKTFNSEVLEQVHAFYINRIASNDEEKVEDLQKFFKECLSGENDKLLQLGTNFDRVVKERDSYIEDEDEYDLQELSNTEVQQRLGTLLDFDNDSEDAEKHDKELSAEIYSKAGIVPTFDANGKFVKGQQRVKKPPKLYSKKYPKFACDTCFAAAKCPEFKAGYVCAYNKLFHRFSTRNADDIINVMQGMVDQNLVRMQRAMVMEVVNGVSDPQVTSFIDQNMRLLNNLMQMRQMGQPTMIHQVQSVRSDGTKETTVRMSGGIATNPQNGGILAKLFEMDSEPKKAEGEVIDVEKGEDKNEDAKQ